MRVAGYTKEMILMFSHEFEEKLVEFAFEGQVLSTALAISNETGWKDRLREWLERAREMAEELKPDSFSVQVSTTPPNVAIQFSFNLGKEN